MSEDVKQLRKLMSRLNDDQFLRVRKDVLEAALNTQGLTEEQVEALANEIHQQWETVDLRTAIRNSVRAALATPAPAGLTPRKYLQGQWRLEEGRSVIEDNGSYATFCNSIRRFGDSLEIRQRLPSNSQEFADETALLIVEAVNALFSATPMLTEEQVREAFNLFSRDGFGTIAMQLNKYLLSPAATEPPAPVCNCEAWGCTGNCPIHSTWARWAREAAATPAATEPPAQCQASCMWHDFSVRIQCALPDGHSGHHAYPLPITATAPPADGERAALERALELLDREHKCPLLKAEPCEVHDFIAITRALARRAAPAEGEGEK